MEACSINRVFKIGRISYKTTKELKAGYKVNRKGIEEYKEIV